MSKDLEKEVITEDILEESEQDVNALIDELTLFDDDLMGLVFDKNIPATQKVLSIILGRPIKVTKVKGQVELRSPELGGRKIRLDVKAVEANGDRINIEVQGDSTGSSVKRARYHSSMIDSRMLKKSQDFDEIKDSYVIFIYEHDKFKKGLPIYHLDRFVEETGEKVGDGSHIIYVNGNYKGKDDIGKLIEDFKCKDSSKMHFKELADGVKYYKETEEGRMKSGGLQLCEDRSETENVRLCAKQL